MKYKIHIRPEAEMDLEEAATWYEMRRKGLGDEFLDQALQAFKTMSENPYMYAIVHRFTRRALMFRFPFAIYYRIEEKTLVVVAVMHGSRHPKRWQKRT